MLTSLSRKALAYTGKELRSHFLYHTFNLQGNAMAVFAGPCEVRLENMKDSIIAKLKHAKFKLTLTPCIYI